MSSFKPTIKILGLHPITGFGMFAIDWMLFGVSGATFGVGWLVTIPIALALSVPCTLIQRFSYGDHWGTAVAKGMLIGILTAIPTPIPSAITLTTGVMGYFAKSNRNDRSIE